VLQDVSVPSGYLTTKSAIEALVYADEEWGRLTAAWERASAAEKATAYRAASDREAIVLRPFMDAVREGQLRPIALILIGKEWRKQSLPADYWQRGSADTALWTGEVDGIGLSPVNRRQLDGCPLCFIRQDWEAWLAKVSETPYAKATKAWYDAHYPTGKGHKTWKEVAIECSKALNHTIDERVLRRFVRGR
jgi:hypothetical protein